MKKGYDLKIYYGNQKIIGGITTFMGSIVIISNLQSHNWMPYLLILISIVLFILGVIQVKEGNQEKIEAESKENKSENNNNSNTIT